MQEAMNTYAVDMSEQQISQNQQELFNQCQNTFDSFKGLGDVAEDMRILSLNAELAAGRAGTYGVSIRALTQYTRELVNRLEQINSEMKKVESFNVAEILRDSVVRDGDSKKPSEVEAEEAEEESNVVSVETETQPEDDIPATLSQFQQEHGGVKYLNEQAKRIAEVVSQSNSIATNMAIEAATAGQYEGTFTNVANDMRGFVDTLKNMVTRAQDSIEKAFRAEKALKELDNA